MRKFFNFWVLGTLALYYVGPIPWEGRTSPYVGLFVVANVLAFNLGYAKFRNPEFCRYSNFDILGVTKSRNIAIAVMLVYAFLSVYHIRLTTGQSLASILTSGFRFDLAYFEYQSYLSERGRLGLASQLVLLLKALIFPVSLVLLVKYFRRSKAVIGAFFFPMVAFSLARGTDKETADLITILAIISIYYGLNIRVQLLLISAIPAAGLLFVLRRFGRFEGNIPTCLPDSAACFNFDSLLAQVSPSLEVAFVFAVQYITQGYEGLSIALSLEHNFNFGLGHLPPLKNVLCATLHVGCELVSYTETLANAGWNTQYRWVSVYTYLANDLTWYLVPLYFFFMGWSLRFAEAQWFNRKDSSGLAIIVIIGIFVLYSSANMQIAVNMDWTFATIFLLYGKALTKRTRRRPLASSVSA